MVRQNAEPRWILPLICRRGHITRNESGAIKDGPFVTYFPMPRPIAAKFADAVARTASPDDEQDAIQIVESAEGPRYEARQNRRDRDNADGPRVRPRPIGNTPGDKPRFAKGPGGFKGKPAGGKPFAGKPKPGFKGKGKPFKGKPGASPRG